MEFLLMLVAMFALMYFLMIRPQQKRMREHQEMQAQLAPGERVLLTSGMFGTIAHAGERQLIVELAPGVEVTVLKGNVARRVVADDEEFEFTDDETIAEEDMDATIADDEAKALAEIEEAYFSDSQPADQQPTDVDDLPSDEAPRAGDAK